MMIDGHHVTLDEKQLKQLRNVGLTMQKDREAVHNRMTLEHDLAVSRQQSDAWKKQAHSQNRAMNTATRMMKGRKVSQDDENVEMTGGELQISSVREVTHPAVNLFTSSH